MTDTEGHDATQGTSRETLEPTGSACGTAGFRRMLVQAAVDLEDVRKAQDRAIASLERVRAQLEAAGDSIAEGVVSSMEGHLSVGKSEVGCDIDTLRMIGDRHDRRDMLPPAAGRPTTRSAADSKTARKQGRRGAPPRKTEDGRPLYGDLWRETVRPYIETNGGWRFYSEILDMCTKESTKYGIQGLAVVHGIERAAKKQGQLLFLILPKGRGACGVWYLPGTDRTKVMEEALGEILSEQDEGPGAAPRATQEEGKA
ncbi:hypothetical protein [Pseudoscardovia radai]|uniref:hypothetical protein n=1 Tax=Pseudoscardovia radai TaxID=987066 RepID=UPI00399595BF